MDVCACIHPALASMPFPIVLYRVGPSRLQFVSQLPFGRPVDSCCLVEVVVVDDICGLLLVVCLSDMDRIPDYRSIGCYYGLGFATLHGLDGGNKLHAGCPLGPCRKMDIHVGDDYRFGTRCVLLDLYHGRVSLSWGDAWYTFLT